MRPELRHLYSPDHDDLDSIVVEDGHFCIFIQAYFGSAGHKGEDSFSFLVCNSNYLRQKAREQQFVFGRPYIIVEQPSRDVIWAALTSIAKKIDGSSWVEIGEKLNRYGEWEFSDYRPYAAPEA